MCAGRFPLGRGGYPCNLIPRTFLNEGNEEFSKRMSEQSKKGLGRLASLSEVACLTLGIVVEMNVGSFNATDVLCAVGDDLS